MTTRNRIPQTTEHTGKVIDGFRIVTASDLGIARSCISFARVRGSVGGEDYIMPVMQPGDNPDKLTPERWAVVERIPISP